MTLCNFPIALGLPAIPSFVLPSAWTPSTAYAVGDKVTNGGMAYECATAGTSAGAGGPAGTGTGIVDNTCQWDYLGPPALPSLDAFILLAPPCALDFF